MEKKTKIVKKTKTTVSKAVHKVVSKVAKKPVRPKAGPVANLEIGLHNLKAPHGATKRKKLLGRGPSSGHGKTSTRGSKGQTSRAGRDFYLGFEGGQTPLIRRMPKRGFNIHSHRAYQIVNIVDLNKIKETSITVGLLEEKGLIKDKNKPVKILGEGELKNSVTVQAHAFSKSASDKITQAGGKTEIINVL